MAAVPAGAPGHLRPVEELLATSEGRLEEETLSESALYKRQNARQTAVAGFVGWVASAVAFALYLLWAYIPEAVLHSYGVTYYPSKYWALAGPIFVPFAFLMAFLLYGCFNWMTTPPLDSISLLYDEHSIPLPHAGALSQQQAEKETPDMADLDMRVVSRMLAAAAAGTRAAEGPLRRRS
eukprot:PLAT4109.1.p1 GENE.PLAT4109.1~~PLAT4109.1.p1  ORF type:complete len:180 (+),score=31.18 PLAT4109.1:44-583(+)